MKDNSETFKIHIVGETQVGKTALMEHVVEGSHDCFLQHSLQSDFMVLSLKVNNKKFIVQLWEDSPVSFHSLIVMYDISNRGSFEKAVQLTESQRTKWPQLPILLLGNKVDLQKERCVMEYEGEFSALKYGTLFNEVSCKSGQNLKESIVELLTVML